MIRDEILTAIYGGQFVEFSKLFPICFSIISHFPVFLTYFPKISQLFCSHFPISYLFPTSISHFALVSHLFLNYFLISHLFPTYFLIISHLFLVISHLCFANLSHLPPDLVKLSSLKAFVMILEQLWKQRSTK